MGKIDADPEDIFLWPNNKDDGDLESLLEQLFPENNKFFNDCWNGFTF